MKSHLEMTANARQEIVSKLDRLSRLLVSKRNETDDPEVKSKFKFFPEIPGDRGDEGGPYKPETVPQSTERKS